MNGDKNLLLGVLAQQMDFIGPTTLVDVLHGWVRDKARPLGELLRAQGRLTAGQLQALELLVEQHVLAHHGDPLASLAAVPVADSLKSRLRSLETLELEPALASLGVGSHDTDPDSTTGYADPARHGTLRYQLLRPHARGGLGEVFVALDEELNREVALKTLQPQHADNTPARQRFVREAEITGGLEHPGIVPVYGLGAYPDGRPYYAMRFIHGDNLNEAIARFHRQSEPRTQRAPASGVSGGGDGPPTPLRFVHGSDFRALLRRFIDVCNAIAYAHSRGVIHRDLKPANVMLGQFGETLVVDWGLAKATRARSASEASVARGADAAPLAMETQMGSALGTPPYMSPEQAAGKLDQLGPATDIYSLGATLYSILTNRPPVEGHDTGEILRRVQMGDAGFRAGGVSPLSAPAKSLRGRTPPAQTPPAPLIAITQKAMALRPEDRYASALELARDVENYLVDEPVSACAEPWSVRARRWARKHRTLVTSAAAVFFMALLALTFGLILVTGYNRQLESANGQLVSANVELQERKKLADENFTLALEAVKAQIFGINNALKHRPGTRTLREQLQKDGTQRLQQLVERTSQRAAVDHATVVAHINLGDVYLQVDLRPALARAEYLKAEALARQLSAADPADTQAERELSIALTKLGDVARQSGQSVQAEEYYTQGLAFTKKLAAAAPKDVQAQRDLSVSLVKLGDMAPQTGKPDQALNYYTQGLVIHRALSAANPQDAQAQRDLTISLTNLGDLAQLAGDTAKAIDYYTETIKIRRGLVERDASDNQAQRGLSISLERLGHIQRQAGQTAQTLDYYLQALAIRTKLAAADPADAQAQRDLSITYEHLGDASLLAGRLDQALDYFTQALGFSQRLAAADPSDAQAQRDLSISYNYLGDVARQAGRTSDALKYFTQGHEISAKLAAASPADTRAQTDLFVSLWNLGSTEQGARRFSAAAGWFRKALEVLRPLHAAGRLHGPFKDAVGISEQELAACDRLAKLQPALWDDPAWMLLWSWPRF